MAGLPSMLYIPCFNCGVFFNAHSLFFYSMHNAGVSSVFYTFIQPSVGLVGLTVFMVTELSHVRTTVRTR